MLPSFARQTIIRLRPSTKTVRGSEMKDWSNPVEKVISGCSVQPASTGLSQDGRVLGLSDGLTAYLPEGTDIVEGDRVLYEGNTYMVDGVPRVWHAAGLISHVQVSLRRWAG